MSALAVFLHGSWWLLLWLVPLAWLAFALLERGRRRRIRTLVGPRVAALVESRGRVRRATREQIAAGADWISNTKRTISRICFIWEVSSL